MRATDHPLTLRCMPFVTDISPGAPSAVEAEGVVGQATPATSATGALKDLWLGASGQIILGSVAGSFTDGGTAGPAAIMDATNVARALAIAPHLFDGTGFGRQRTPAIFKVVSALAVGAETAVWTPGAGKKFRALAMLVGLSVAASLTLRDGTGGTVIFKPDLPAAQSLFILLPGNGYLSALANNVMTATSSVAANLDATFIGTEE